jgi:hypothetical protein
MHDRRMISLLPIALSLTLGAAAPEVATVKQLSKIELPLLKKTLHSDTPIDVDIDAPEIVVTEEAIYMSRLPRSKKQLRKLMELNPGFDKDDPDWKLDAVEEALVEGRRLIEMKKGGVAPKRIHIVADRRVSADLLQRLAWTIEQASFAPYRIYKDGKVLKALPFAPWKEPRGQQGMFSLGGSTLGDKPVILGSLDKDVIRGVIRASMGDISVCYEQSAAQKLKTGKVTMKFIINGQGKVTDAKVAKDALNDQGTTGCMAKVLKRLRFPKPKGGGIVIVNYPFVFKLADEADNKTR